MAKIAPVLQRRSPRPVPYVAAAAVAVGLAAGCSSSKVPTNLHEEPAGDAGAVASDDASDDGIFLGPDGGGRLQTHIVVNAGADPVCGACAVVVAETGGGTRPYVYAWSDPSLEGPGPFQVCPNQTTTYSVTVTDSSARAGELATPAMSATASAMLACSPSDGSTAAGALRGCQVASAATDAGIDAGGTYECSSLEVDPGTAWTDGGVVYARTSRTGGTLLAGQAYKFTYNRILPFQLGSTGTVEIWGTADDDLCKAEQKLFSMTIDGDLAHWNQSSCFTPDRNYDYVLTKVTIQGAVFYFNGLAAGTICDSCSP